MVVQINVKEAVNLMNKTFVDLSPPKSEDHEVFCWIFSNIEFDIRLWENFGNESITLGWKSLIYSLSKLEPPSETILMNSE